MIFWRNTILTNLNVTLLYLLVSGFSIDITYFLHANERNTKLQSVYLPVRYTGELTLKALTYVCKSKNMETKGGFNLKSSEMC